MIWTATQTRLIPGTESQGRFRNASGVDLPCALGKQGLVAAADKREGDGKSPLGVWPIRYGFYRADRVAKPVSEIAFAPLHPDDGWCDAADHEMYNRFITFPFDASAEHLWRDDGAYDIILVLGHNDDPIVPGMGSAIFLHCAKPGFTPTEGCIALARVNLINILSQMRTGDGVEISG